MSNNLTIGDQNIGSGVSGVAPRGGRQGDAIMSQLHNRYYETARVGKLFYAYSTPGILSAAGTAMTGLILWNGAATVNLVLSRINLRVSVTSASMTGIDLAAGAVGAQTTAPTTTTAVTKTGSTFLGAATSVASAYSVATTLATVSIASLMHNTAAISTTGADSVEADLSGFIVPPFTVVCLAALGAASAAAAVSSTIYWEEVQV